MWTQCSIELSSKLAHLLEIKQKRNSEPQKLELC